MPRMNSVSQNPRGDGGAHPANSGGGGGGQTHSAGTNMTGPHMNPGGGGMIQQPGVVFKVLLRDDIIRFRLLQDVNYTALVQRVHAVLEVPEHLVKLKYQDDENEWCILGSDSDLKEALGFARMRAMQSGGVLAGHVHLKMMDSSDGLKTLRPGVHKQEVGGMSSAAYACHAHNMTFTVKVGFGDDTVRLKLAPNMTFADLMVRLQDSIEVDPSGLRLTYKDDDEEWCTLIGDADLDECRAVCCASGTMRLQAS